MIQRIKGEDVTVQLFIDGVEIGRPNSFVGDVAVDFEIDCSKADYLGETSTRPFSFEIKTDPRASWHGLLAAVLSRQAIDRALGWVTGAMDPWRMLPPAHAAGCDCDLHERVELVRSIFQALEDGDLPTADRVLAWATQHGHAWDIDDADGDDYDPRMRGLLEALTAP